MLSNLGFPRKPSKIEGFQGSHLYPKWIPNCTPNWSKILQKWDFELWAISRRSQLWFFFKCRCPWPFKMSVSPTRRAKIHMFAVLRILSENNKNLPEMYAKILQKRPLEVSRKNHLFVDPFLAPNLTNFWTPWTLILAQKLTLGPSWVFLWPQDVPSRPQDPPRQHQGLHFGCFSPPFWRI